MLQGAARWRRTSPWWSAASWACPAATRAGPWSVWPRLRLRLSEQDPGFGHQGDGTGHQDGPGKVIVGFGAFHGPLEGVVELLGDVDVVLAKAKVYGQLGQFGRRDGPRRVRLGEAVFLRQAAQGFLELAEYFLRVLFP